MADVTRGRADWIELARSLENLVATGSMRLDRIPLPMVAAALTEVERQAAAWRAAAAAPVTLRQAPAVGLSFLSRVTRIARSMDSDDLAEVVAHRADIPRLWPALVSQHPAVVSRWLELVSVLDSYHGWFDQEGRPTEMPASSAVLETVSPHRWQDQGYTYQQELFRTAEGWVERVSVLTPPRNQWSVCRQPRLIPADFNVARGSLDLVGVLSTAADGWDLASGEIWGQPGSDGDLSDAAEAMVDAAGRLYDYGPLPRDDVVIAPHAGYETARYRQLVERETLPGGVSTVRCRLLRNNRMVLDVEFANGPGEPTAIFVEPRPTLVAGQLILPLASEDVTTVREEVPSLLYAMGRHRWGEPRPSDLE